MERLQSTAIIANSNDVKVRVAINTEIIGKIDFENDLSGAWSLTHNYSIKDLSAEEFAQVIERRANFTSICLNEAGKFHRKKEHFKYADIFAVDIDNDKEILLLDERGEQVRDAKGRALKTKVRCDDKDYITLEALLNDPFVQRYALIAYTTPSHTEHHHKLRIVFRFPQTIKDRESFERIVRAFIWHFGSDESCKDASRFFYGTGPSGQVVYLGNTLTGDAIEHELAEHDSAHPRVERSEAVRLVAHSDHVDPEKSADRRRFYAERAIATAQRLIRESVAPSHGSQGKVSGNRHKARCRAAYLIGGYIAGGVVEYAEGRAALEEAARANTDNFSKAMKTIDECLAAGESEPITFQELEAERLLYLKSRQSMSDEERKARAKALKDATPEEQARQVLGAKETRAMARLWAEAELNPESRDLLFVLEAMAEDEEFIECPYAEIFPLLYKATDAFEMTPTGGRALKSSARKKIRERFERLEAEQTRAGITFAYLTPGHLDENDNPAFSNVRLLSHEYLAEIERRAEKETGFVRHREASRVQATARFVAEKAGKHLARPKPHISRGRKISHGLKCAKGKLNAAIERMRKRGDRPEQIWRTIAELLPVEFLEFVASDGFSSTLIEYKNREPGSEANGEPCKATAHAPDGQKVDFGVPSKTPATSAGSTDHTAQNSNSVQSDAEIWEQVCARAQSRAVEVEPSIRAGERATGESVRPCVDDEAMQSFAAATESALEGSPPTAEPEPAQVKMMITRDERQQLYDWGYSKEEIDRMKPEEARRIVVEQRCAGPPRFCEGCGARLLADESECSHCHAPNYAAAD